MESSPVVNDTFITPREAAAVLRLSLQTVYRQIALGVIPAVRVGTSHRIPRSEFEAKFGITADRGAA